MMEIFEAHNLVALLTLTSLEIVLGIDNIVFIAIIAGRLPKEQREKARVVGLGLAVITRLLLLFSLSWMTSMTSPLFSISALGQDFSGRDLILLGGGIFLIYKATVEIHAKALGKDEHANLETPDGRKRTSFPSVIFQILIVDMVFSLDSVITAVGMSNNISVMAAAVIAAVIIMLIFSGGIVRYIDKHPTVKMLALSFLLLVGFVLVVEGWGKHIEKGYIYFAMAFSLAVEMLNLRMAKARSKAPQAPH